MQQFVKPLQGYKVKDPSLGDYLPIEGRLVEGHELYWHRLAGFGDVQVVPPEPVEQVKKGK